MNLNSYNSENENFCLLIRTVKYRRTRNGLQESRRGY